MTIKMLILGSLLDKRQTHWTLMVVSPWSPPDVWIQGLLCHPGVGVHRPGCPPPPPPPTPAPTPPPPPPGPQLHLLLRPRCLGRAGASGGHDVVRGAAACGSAEARSWRAADGTVLPALQHLLPGQQRQHGACTPAARPHQRAAGTGRVCVCVEISFP